MNNLKGLFERIESIHDDHDVEAKVSKKVQEAIQEHIGKNDTAIEVNLQRIADHLANGRVAEATQLAVLYCKRDPEKAPDQDKAGAGQALRIAK